jgi:hypothetical protein
MAVLALTCVCVAGAAPGASAATRRKAGATSGGVGFTVLPSPASTPAHPIVVGYVAKIIRGVAYAPSYAPIQVQRAIWAGNRIRQKPYIYGGGHGTFIAAGYDCSGSVSYLLHGGGLLSTPLDSSDFMSWGAIGPGRWITVYTNPAHAFVQIAGIRLDTSAEGSSGPVDGSGPRWRARLRNTRGFTARHLPGF